MDFSLTDNQREFIATVQRLVKGFLPHILHLERNHVFPWEIVEKAWNMGILNLSIPETVKGFGVDAVSSALIIRELSYGDSGIATSAMCNDLANVVIAQHGTQAQQEAFLKPFVDTPQLASFCLTEPGAGSDNSAMTTFMAKRDDGSYVLNGAKCFITNASYASQFTVFCKVGKPAGQFMACVVVPAGPLSDEAKRTAAERGREIVLPAGGRIVIGKAEDKLGQRLSNTATVTFEDVVVQPEQILGTAAGVSNTSSMSWIMPGPWWLPLVSVWPGGPWM
jgi:acyl-CoA dehydrogenase